MMSLSRSAYVSNNNIDKSKDQEEPRVRNSGELFAMSDREGRPDSREGRSRENQRAPRKVIVSIYGKDVAEYEIYPEGGRHKSKRKRAA